MRAMYSTARSMPRSGSVDADDAEREARRNLSLGDHARGPIAGAISLVIEKMSTPLYRDVDVYSRATTPEGLRMTLATGFQPGCDVRGKFAPHLFTFAARARTRVSAPIYDGYQRPREPQAIFR